MQQNLFNLANSYNQKVYETTKELTNINLRVYEKLVQKHFELAGTCLEGGVRQLELARDVKDLAGYFKAQGEMTKNCAEKALSTTQETLGILSESRNEINQWLENGLKAVASVAEVNATKKAA